MTSKITSDFIADERRQYKFKLGQLIASSLSGFIGGFIVATIIWVMIFKVL